MPGDERKTKIPGRAPTPNELGNSGWNILHSSAAVYPYRPTRAQQTAMRNFIYSWSELYACEWCAYHMRDYVKQHPPMVSDKFAVTRYVCELHNEVNERIGKDVYDCDPMKVLQRWHPGYPDKMGDKPSMEERVAEGVRKQREARQGGAAAATSSATPSPPAASAAAKEGQGAGRRWWPFGGGGSSTAEAQAPAPGSNSTNTNTTHSDSSSGRSPLQSVEILSAHHGTAPPSAPPKVFADPNGRHGGRGGWMESGWASAAADSAASAPAARPPVAGAKPADGETDVDVLRRLRGCQVYCPEDEELAKK